MTDLQDEYASLSEGMRARLDTAELVVFRLHDFVDLLADRDNMTAREICLIMGWAKPRGAP